MDEVWKDVPRYEGLYEVSNRGRIRSLRTGRILAQSRDRYGYLVFYPKVNRVRHCVRIHRCVALAFIPNPENLPEVNHIDGNKGNPDCSNLEWTTCGDNHRHAYQTGLKTKSSDRPVVQMKDGKVVARYKSMTAASRATGIKLSAISMALRSRSHWSGGYTWHYAYSDSGGLLVASKDYVEEEDQT